MLNISNEGGEGYNPEPIGNTETSHTPETEAFLEKDPLITSQEKKILASWKLSDNLVAKIESTVRNHSEDYRQPTLIAEIISRSDKYIAPDGRIFLKSARNVMGGYSGGECGSITSHLGFEFGYLGITDTLEAKGIVVRRASVLEPTMFSSNAAHMVLILYKGRETDLDSLPFNENNIIIIDAPLQRIRSLPKSGYHINEVYETDVIFADITFKAADWDPNQSIKLNAENRTMLCLTHDGSHALDLSYIRYEDKIFPMVTAWAADGSFTYTYMNPTTHKIEKSEGVPEDAVKIVTTLQSANVEKLKPEDAIEFTDNDDITWQRWKAKDGSLLGVPFTKEVGRQSLSNRLLQNFWSS